MDRSSLSPWSSPQTVAGFVRAAPNEELLRFAAGELARRRGTGRGWAIDLGCGAGRNAVPLARLGWRVVGLDLSGPMLAAGAARARAEALAEHVRLACAPMERLPLADGCGDLVVAHGIWNLARSAAEFRAAVAEAARVARPGAGLFLFTFSRSTFPPETEPVPGEPFAYTEFSGEPQCFLSERQLFSELAAAGFAPDPAVPLRELNRRAGRPVGGGPPVIWEGTFRRL